ncbi:beta-galactosidase trimerization domain-containing protein [Paenibacillus qinlingensis]|uniref:beta-galactosidase n=1 Tax=Paenibacillus qinlingensis TaxID=1837343 RepID=A0ABU1NXD1_9BACL|nr:beta-galactosidase trimerization domain-containing protein [Paenibacillus qinlingensis]MDR6551721.1 hypothetical protein [Paenibacillus qinlingensis]
MKKYDITYSTEIETDHPVWAKPYAKGTLRVLLLPSVLHGREMIELVQRIDVDFETVTVDKMWDLNKWGLGDYYDIRGAQWDFSVMYDNLEKVMDSDLHFDTLVIPGLNGWGYFTARTRAAILRRVEQGAGLVLIKPYHGDGLEKSEELELLSPIRSLVEEGLNHKGYPKIAHEQLKSEPWTASNHYITNGIPLELFPFDKLAIYPYEAQGEVIIASESGLPVAAVKTYGQGRVVAFGYYPGDVLPQHREFATSNCFDSNLDKWKGGHSGLSFQFQEYVYGMIGRSIIWAAGKEPDCSFEDVSYVAAPSLAIAGGSATPDGSTAATDCLLIKLTDQSEGCVLQYSIKNAFDHIVCKGETHDLTSFPLPVSLRLGGQYRVELHLVRGGKVLDWSTKVLHYPKTSSIKALSVDQELANPGERLTGVVSLTNGQGEILLKLVDYFGYVHAQQMEVVAGNQSVSFEMGVPQMPSLYVQLEAELRQNGHLVDKQVQRIIVPAQDRKISDFETFLVPSNRGIGDFTKLVGDRFREMGITGLFPGSNKLSALSGVEGMGVYWYNRHAYTERKEAYLRTKDKRHLHRKPCFNDPGFWSEIREKVHRNVSSSKAMRPISYFANDEGSITCYTDEQDLCFCTHCMGDMQKWLQSEYADLEALNSIWGTTFHSWSDIEPYTYEEARKTGHYGSWGDHRRFMEMSFAGAYQKISAYIQEVDPEGVTRLSGCQASTTYSGYDYYQLHQHVGYVEAYSVGHQMEMHRSFAKPDTAIGVWHGYGNKGTVVNHAVWNAMFHGMTLLSLFHDQSILNPDLTYSQSARDFGRNIKEIRREGIGKLLLYTAKRDHLGIALHYSMNAVHGSYMRGDHQRFEQNRSGWIQLLEDMGYQYQMLATPQIEEEALINNGYKLLILPYSIAFSDKEASAIERFVQSGGTIIGDFQTGIMDEHCKLYDSGKLDGVFGIERLTTEVLPFFSNSSCAVMEDFPYFRHTPSVKVKGEIANGIGAAIAESGIRAQTSKAAFVDDFMRRIAQVTVHEYGNGKAVYLNFALNPYAEIRLKSNGEQLRDMLKKIFALSHVEKFASLQTSGGRDLDCGYESFYYSDGEAKYVGVLRNPMDTGKVGHDGVMLGGDTHDSETAEQVFFALAAASHVYDIRKKLYVGFTNKVEMTLLPGETALLAILPTMKERITLDMAAACPRGEEIQLSLKIESAKPESSYTSVCSLSFYDPDGQFAWMYADNLIMRADGVKVTYTMPLNEKTGTWQVVAKDVATGISEIREFEVV